MTRTLTDADVRAMLRTPQAGEARASTATTIATYILGRGRSAPEVLEIMRPYREACDPPLSPTELADIILAVAPQAGAGTPNLIQTRSGWVASWSTPGVRLTIERLASGRESLTAELAVDRIAADGRETRLLGMVRTGLMSTGSREGLARSLAKVAPDLPWGEIVERSFREVIDAYRAGDPPVRLGSLVLSPSPEAEYAIDPLVLARNPTMFFAEPGFGKSWMALAIAAHLSGYDVLPFERPALQKVAYLDWEWDADQHARRLGMLIGRDAAADCSIDWLRMDGSLVSRVDQLARAIDREGYTFLIIDSLGAACGEDPEKASSVLPFANAIRKLNIGSLWVTHTTKNGDQGKAFGSQYFTATARAAWQVVRVSDPDRSTMRLALHQRKLNSGQAAEPISLAFTFERGRCSIARTDIYDDAELSQGLGATDRVLHAINGGTRTAAALHRATGLTPGAIEKALIHLERSRRVCKMEGGAWSALRPSQEPVDGPHGVSGTDLGEWSSSGENAANRPPEPPTTILPDASDLDTQGALW